MLPVNIWTHLASLKLNINQPLPSGTSFQKAEFVALTTALTLTANKRANIYTDSKHTFHIIHSHAAIWKERGLLSTKGSPITNALLILHLLKAANMQTEVGIIHCRGHQVASDPISRGNHATDRHKTSLTLIISSITYGNPQHKAPLPP